MRWHAVAKGEGGQRALLLAVAALGAMAMWLMIAGESSAAQSRPCGIVSGSGTNSDSKWRVTITKGSPSCHAVRAIARKYGNPKSVHYSCPEKSHLCAYGVYAEGWRCTGLFQGIFGCWHGGDAMGQNAREKFRGALVY